MKTILEHCSVLPQIHFEEGEVLLAEGISSDKLFVLCEGVIEVFRADDTIAMVSEPGAVFGEMSVLLGIEHTASVRTKSASTLYLIEGAKKFLAQNPAFLMPVACMLAARLRNSTTYLIDLKRQFRDQGDHFTMVDQVLESMAHDQEHHFTPDDQLPVDP